jgi:hypothetical protein
MRSFHSLTTQICPLANRNRRHEFHLAHTSGPVFPAILLPTICRLVPLAYRGWAASQAATLSDACMRR